MLRLRLAGIPLEIHMSHVVFMPILALFLAPRVGWAEHAPAVLRAALAGSIVSSALILHELGLAFAAKAFGYRPVVQLIGMTGRTIANPNETVPWHRDVAMNLAAPAMGITLGFTAASLWLPMRGRGTVLEYALMLTAASHLIWAGVNLLPIHPLKGGRIVTAIARRVFGRDGFLYAQVLGLFVGTSLAAVSLAFGQPLGIFALIYVAQTAILISAFRRGVLPREAAHPLEQAAAQAESLYAEDDVEQAQRIGYPLLEADLQPPLRARVHVLLGWCALKLGEGRSALDHFAQSPGTTVPPEALAAAFSLIGDDSKAAALWEQAAASKDPTLVHEWAGALIRLGRENEAWRLPGLHRPAAWHAARRVLEARGQWRQVAELDERRFTAEPSAARAYEAAAAYAKANAPEEALRLLALAAQHGFDDLQRVLHDDGLSSLRSHAGFIAFLEGLRAGPRN